MSEDLLGGFAPPFETDGEAARPPRRPRPGPDTAYVAPRSESEHALAAIWKDLLGLERVGIRDDFFALGGDPGLEERLMARLRLAFGLEMPREAFAAAPTIEALTEAVLKAKVRRLRGLVRGGREG
ncbi:MAG: phosphopantetheine-binding protein, partial [Acidobacteriota bacterium]|nr:phosphopantetheine-binding protein [Acidobacteriota bacterium]